MLTLATKHDINNTASLAVMLQELYINITGTDIKSRITRINKWLLNENSKKEFDEDESSNNESQGD